MRVFTEMDLGRAQQPTGWLRRSLERQRHGLTGHLDVAGPPFDTRLWAVDAIPHRPGASPWWPYEQTAYWVDGLTRCGLALNDPSLMKRAREQFDYVLAHADRDGYLGPRSCKPPMPAGRWAHMIFFRACLAWQAHTGDERILPALQRYYLEARHDHSGHRDVCHIEIMCELAERTGCRELVTEAEGLWARYQQTLSEHDRALAKDEVRANRPAFGHGVTFCETSKQAIILYRLTGKALYRRYAEQAFRKLQRYHMLVSGAPSSTEALRGVTALDAHETCDVVDFSWSAGHYLLATGEVPYADAVERATFNALPGATTKDFKALQYFSGPNQVIAARNSCHGLCATGGQWMSYRPRPGTECCTSNVTRAWPNYAARMWLAKKDDPVAALYGPSTLHFVRNGEPVTITQDTYYPFSDQVDFVVQTAKPQLFTLWLRIPVWCSSARVTLNDQPVKPRCRAGKWFPVSHRFAANDRVRLHLPMTVRLTEWPDGGVALERGPLVFALPIPARARRDRRDPHQRQDFPAWELFPAGPWNYALDVDRDKLAEQVQVVHGPVSPDPWDTPPLWLEVPARRVRGWRLRQAKVLPTYGATLVDAARNIWSEHKTVVRGLFPITPPLPDPATLRGRLGKRVENIRLAPYGHTLLRLTVFPWARRPPA